jgi:hypothetical protein
VIGVRVTKEWQNFRETATSVILPRCHTSTHDPKHILRNARPWKCLVPRAYYRLYSQQTKSNEMATSVILPRCHISTHDPKHILGNARPWKCLVPRAYYRLYSQQTKSNDPLSAAADTRGMTHLRNTSLKWKGKTGLGSSDRHYKPSSCPTAAKCYIGLRGTTQEPPQTGSYLFQVHLTDTSTLIT